MRFVVLFLFLIPFLSISQKSESTPDTQWWLGLRGGANVTSLSTLKDYSVLYNEQSEIIESTKTRMGWQIGIEGDFDLFGILELSLMPGLKKIGWDSDKSTSWQNGVTAQVYELEQTHSYDLLYFDLPLSVKFDFINMGLGGIKIKGKDKAHIKVKNGGGLIAFVQGGVFYNRLMNATTSIEKNIIYNQVESNSEFDQGVSSLFLKNSYGWLAGGGVGYDFQSIRIELDVLYRKSLHNVVDVSERYSQTTLVNDYYEVLDDLKFSNMEFSLRLLFPFKFIYSGSFKKI